MTVGCANTLDGWKFCTSIVSMEVARLDAIGFNSTITSISPYSRQRDVSLTLLKALRQVDFHSR